jgi:hypothetical protein
MGVSNGTSNDGAANNGSANNGAVDNGAANVPEENDDSMDVDAPESESNNNTTPAVPGNYNLYFDYMSEDEKDEDDGPEDFYEEFGMV